MVRRRREPQWHLVLTALLLVAAVASILVLNWQTRDAAHPPVLPPLPSPARADAGTFGDRLYTRIDTTLAELGIWPALIAKQREYISDELAGPVDSIAVRVPADLPLAVVNLALTRVARRLGGAVFRATEDGSRTVALLCGIDSVTTTVFWLHRDRRLKRRAGSIAIVLDELGAVPWNRSLAQRFCALPHPLTLSVLPNEGNPRDIVELAFRLRELEVPSIPVNFLIPIDGNQVTHDGSLTPERCLRALCVMRLVNPRAEIRVAGGREGNLRSLQPLALYPANSLFVEGYLTTRGDGTDETYQMIRDAGFEVAGNPLYDAARSHAGEFRIPGGGDQLLKQEIALD